MTDQELLEDVRNLKRDTRVPFYAISEHFSHTASWSSNLIHYKVPPLTRVQRLNLFSIREYLMVELIKRGSKWKYVKKQQVRLPGLKS